jgi:hypothetical protein
MLVIPTLRASDLFASNPLPLSLIRVANYFHPSLAKSWLWTRRDAGRYTKLAQVDFARSPGNTLVSARMDNFDKVRLQFEALCKDLKRAKGLEERRRIHRKMAVAIRKMDAMVALKNLSGPTADD